MDAGGQRRRGPVAEQVAGEDDRGQLDQHLGQVAQLGEGGALVAVGQALAQRPGLVGDGAGPGVQQVRQPGLGGPVGGEAAAGGAGGVELGGVGGRGWTVEELVDGVDQALGLGLAAEHPGQLGRGRADQSVSVPAALGEGGGVLAQIEAVEQGANALGGGEVGDGGAGRHGQVSLGWPRRVG